MNRRMSKRRRRETYLDRAGTGTTRTSHRENFEPAHLGLLSLKHEFRRHLLPLWPRSDLKGAIAAGDWGSGFALVHYPAVMALIG